MKEIVSKKNCTGCTACMNKCPKGAISFIENEEGFKYPMIDQSKCIDCGLCKKICPVLNTNKNESMNKCFVAYNKAASERLNASSGSIFSLLANYVLDNKGIVVGAAFDSDHHLRHIAVEKKSELEPLRKSKYLQSDLDNIFKYIKEQSKKRKILFVGTPCQVAGLKAFAGQEQNIILVDLICHGTPSPKLFEKYIKELETVNNKKLEKYDFRDNSTGWDSYSNRAVFKGKEIITKNTDNEYMKLFLSDIALRESCYNCNFKLGNKYSDITLGDFWGVKDFYPEMYNKEGVSAIIINTKLGEDVFDSIKSNIDYNECMIEEITNGNLSLVKSPIRPKNRDKFFDEMNNISVERMCKKYTKKVLMIQRIFNKLKKILRGVFL